MGNHALDRFGFIEGIMYSLTAIIEQLRRVAKMLLLITTSSYTTGFHFMSMNQAGWNPLIQLLSSHRRHH